MFPLLEYPTPPGPTPWTKHLCPPVLPVCSILGMPIKFHVFLGDYVLWPRLPRQSLRSVWVIFYPPVPLAGCPACSTQLTCFIELIKCAQSAGFTAVTGEFPTMGVCGQMTSIFSNSVFPFR